MKHRHIRNVPHTFANYWNTVTQSTDKLIVDLIECGRKVSRQSRAKDTSVVSIIYVQEGNGEFGLDELKWLLWARVQGACVVRTSLSGSILDKTSSGALLTSSICSKPVGTTTHFRKLAILNRPGLV